uniref:Uncharacterized protein n=1 Tax=Nelumbo nucifera TaxID=4432 RepID=A0A822YTD3_NELNU|nr:TPA_asm: hypothetical protein HUJ06_011339 [Nelumbo nucifera]
MEIVVISPTLTWCKTIDLHNGYFGHSGALDPLGPP